MCFAWITAWCKIVPIFLLLRVVNWEGDHSICVFLWVFFVCMCSCVTMCTVCHSLPVKVRGQAWIALGIFLLVWDRASCLLLPTPMQLTCRALPFSATHLTIGTLGLQINTVTSSLTWFLGIWIQFLTLAKQALSPTESSPHTMHTCLCWRWKLLGAALLAIWCIQHV